MRVAWLVGALLAFAGAAVILIQAGLPDRARFASAVIEGGRVVAPEIGALAPPFELTTLTGRLTLSDLRGSLLILNFWATWCEPCVVEMPYLQGFYDQFQERGLRLVAVNLGEKRAVVEDWVQQNDLHMDIALDPDGAVATAYRLRGQPSTFVIAPTGEITSIFYGPVASGQLEAAVAPFLRR
jgi:peroxiredoxin